MKRILSAVALAALAACGSDLSVDEGAPTSTTSSPVARETAPTVSSENAASLRDGNTAFALDMLRTLEAQSPGRNVFFSPHSITVALAMTWAGARGTTAEEMARTLHFTLPDAQTHDAMNALDLAIASRGTVSAANALWDTPRIPFAQPFLDRLSASYGADVHLVDFREGDSARVGINRWVSTTTRDRINDLLPPGSVKPQTALVLVNAIHFQDDWQSPFAPSATQPAPFHAAGGDVTASMMNGLASAPYVAGDGYQAVALPYRSGLSFLAILPDDLAAFEAALDARKVADIAASLAPKLVAVRLPKVKIEGETVALKSALQALGMNAAFGAADFTGMAPPPTELAIDDAYHQAFVAVDEKGTEAAAATAVVVNERSSIGPEAEVSIALDRPFLFAIRDDATGAILFLGHLATPAQ